MGKGTREGATELQPLLFWAQPRGCVNACAPASPPPPPLSFSPALQTLTFSLSFAWNRSCPRGADATELMLIGYSSPSSPLPPAHTSSLATTAPPMHTHTHTHTHFLVLFVLRPAGAPLSRRGGGGSNGSRNIWGKLKVVTQVFQRLRRRGARGFPGQPQDT